MTGKGGRSVRPAEGAQGRARTRPERAIARAQASWRAGTTSRARARAHTHTHTHTRLKRRRSKKPWRTRISRHCRFLSRDGFTCPTHTHTHTHTHKHTHARTHTHAHARTRTRTRTHTHTRARARARALTAAARLHSPMNRGGFACRRAPGCTPAAGSLAARRLCASAPTAPRGAQTCRDGRFAGPPPVGLCRRPPVSRPFLVSLVLALYRSLARSGTHLIKF